MDGRVTSVTTDVNLRGEICLFQNPYFTLKYQVNITTRQKALRDEIKAISAGHPTVFSVE